MERADTPATWSAATSLEKFRDYLLQLAHEAESRTWRNATIPAFLGGWASYLVAGDESFDSMPGWQGLARLLHEARDHEFVYVCHSPTDLIDDEQRVSTAGELIFFLVWLCRDFAADHEERAKSAGRGLYAEEGRWAHSNLSDWLFAWASWLHGAHMPTDSRRERSEVEPVTWRSCANQLAAARVYE